MMQPYDGEPEPVFGGLDDHGQARHAADDRLAGLAAEALAGNPLVHGRRLEILVQNGVIILTGELASADSRAAAGRTAWTVEGVMDVCNRVTVAGL
jgi:osmotically-inducible protein OsmY